LSERSWKTIPWAEHNKTIKDLLLDVVVDLPSALEALDKWYQQEATPEKEEHRKYLIDVCVQIDRNLLRWFDRHGRSLLPVTGTSGEANDWSTMDLGHANVLSLYWVACILVINTLRSLDGLEGMRRAHINPDEACRNIVSVVPTFLRPEVGLFRVHLTTFPMAVVLIYLKSRGPQFLQAERALLAGYLQRPECAFTSRFLHSMVPDSFDEVVAGGPNMQ
jgi:hypothetical protein